MLDQTLKIVNYLVLKKVLSKANFEELNQTI